MKSSIITYLLVVCFLNQSNAQVFSDLQSACLVGKRNIEITPSLSKVGSVGFYGETSYYSQTNIGIQGGWGISDKVDFRARFEHIILDGGGNATVIGIGPKFSFIDGRMAGYLPIGAAFGDRVNTDQNFIIQPTLRWKIQPTLLFTFPIINNLEFNPSLKYIIQFVEGADNFVAINLGMGIVVYGKIVVRPEFGLLYNPGENDFNQHLSLGFTLFPKWGSEEEN